jgi:hypothetical protein
MKYNQGDMYHAGFMRVDITALPYSAVHNTVTYDAPSQTQSFRSPAFLLHVAWGSEYPLT